MNFTRPLNSASGLPLLSPYAPIALPIALLIVWVGFTMHKELSYNRPALAKKAGVGIDTPLLSGAQVASFAVMRLFLCVFTFMVGWMGSVRARRFLIAVVSTRSVRHPFEIDTSCVAVRFNCYQEGYHA